mgnify:CR=1 FL=1
MIECQEDIIEFRQQAIDNHIAFCHRDSLSPNSFIY